MIKIEEKDPIKLSGLSSLFISFKYNQEIIDIIKSSEKYIYNKKDYTWEVPCTSLAYLLDQFTYVDDITLILKKDDEEKIHYYPKLVSEYKITPFQHQLEAIEWGLNQDSGLILDEAGLGKTATIIHLAEELKEQKGLEHCLIICGINSLKANWESEIKKHSGLTSRIIGKRINSRGKVSYASIKERAEELMHPIEEFFMIINIESLRFDDIVQALRTTTNKIDMAVFDEAHKIANSTAAQAKGLLKLTKYAHKIGMTGTLITATPLNAYTPLKWIGVEKANLTNFKSQYCVFGGFGGHQIIGYKNLNMLKDEIDSCSIRRTKDIIKDLPPKTIITEIIEMSDEHRKFYESVKDGVKSECNKINLNTTNVLALTTRLMQATACPSILTTQDIMSSKVERAIELCDEFISNGNKVVIMSTFKEPLNLLKKLLKDYNPLLFTGDVSEDEFEKNKIKFQEDPKYKIALGTVSKAGTGLTLNAASYMICLNTPWNAANQSQAENRIHRVNNISPAFIYRLICQDTIDERVNKIIEMKQAMGDYIVDDKLDEKASNILREYIQDL